MSSNNHENEAEKVCSSLISLKNKLMKSEMNVYEGQKRHIVTSFY